MNNTSIKISTETLSLDACHQFVSNDSCGGISTFVGTVRNVTLNKKVTHLDFSTYKPMAIKEMHKIAALAIEKFDIKKFHTIVLDNGNPPLFILEELIDDWIEASA